MGRPQYCINTWNVIVDHKKTYKLNRIYNKLEISIYRTKIFSS